MNNDRQAGKQISRRTFVQRVSTGLAGAALGTGILGRIAESVTTSRTRVVIHRDEGATDGATIVEPMVKQLLSEAVDALTDRGGWEALFPDYKSGDGIAIKVNCIERRMSSHPEVVAAVVEGLTGIGVPENDIVVYDRSERELRAAGYTINTSTSGVRVVDASQYGFHSDPMDMEGTTASTIRLPKLLTDARYLINVPVLKNHGGARITFALKNHAGTISNPGAVHQVNLHRCIAVMNRAPDIASKTRLIVGDCLFGIYRGGPGGSPQFTYNGLLVGTDPVAVDLQAKMILDAELEARGLGGPIVVPHLDHATNMGLGTNRLEEIEAVSPQDVLSIGSRTWGQIKRGRGKP